MSEILLNTTAPGASSEFGAGNHLAQNLYLSERVEMQHVYDLNYMLDLELVRQQLMRFTEKGFFLTHFNSISG